MNTSFTNSNFGRILYVAIITLIVAATIFVIWYMTTGYKLGTYAPDTRLGSVYIGGLTEEEVDPRLGSKINYWYNDETISFELEYQGYTYEFDRNLFYFDVEESILGIEDGVINEISVYYQGSDREGVVRAIQEKPFLSGIVDNLDIDRIINDVLNDASLMKSYSIKHADDYLITPEDSYEVLGTADLIVPEGVSLTDMVAKIGAVYEDGKIKATGEELFDVLPLFGDTMNDSEMTVLSSAMLELVINTNFIINEVHYKPTIEEKYTVFDYPFYARNTHVREVVNESFSFYNPNTSDYMFEIDLENETISLIGLPFEYEIIVVIYSVDDPDHLLDFFVEQDKDADKRQDGQFGVLVEVFREIKDLDGDVYQPERIILTEFYPPVNQVTYDPEA